MPINLSTVHVSPHEVERVERELGLDPMQARNHLVGRKLAAAAAERAAVAAADRAREEWARHLSSPSESQQ